MSAANRRPDYNHPRQRILASVAREVSHRLHNTPAIVRKSYIHPAVIDAWLAGKLDNGVGEKLRRSVRTSPSSSRPEAALRRFHAQHRLNGEHQATINAGTSGAAGC